MATDRPHRAAVAVAAVWQGSAIPAAPPALELAWDQVVGWRLRRHHLDERAPGGDLLAVVAEIAGLHAQIMSSAELGDKLRHSWGSPLKPAASLGLLCFGPSDGRLVRFTRPDQWLPAWHGDQDPGAALLETARRYLRACGVVTREDYARWWGMLAPEGGRVLKRLGDEVVPVKVGGSAAWMLAADAEEIAEASPAPSVRLLPAFDQYVVAATRHAEQLMPGPFKDRVYRPQGWLSPVLLARGRMLGTWRQTSRAAASRSPSSPSPSSPPPSAARPSTKPNAWPPGPAPPSTFPGPTPRASRAVTCGGRGTSSP
jgi:hypothetical protein